MICRAIGQTKAAHKELQDKALIAAQALANSQADVEKLQVDFNDASGLVQQKERELREARLAAEQKAKQLDVARLALGSPSTTVLLCLCRSLPWVLPSSPLPPLVRFVALWLQ